VTHKLKAFYQEFCAFDSSTETLYTHFFIFIVTPCMLSSYSIITPTTAHTGCFTTCGYYCRRSLWSKKFI